MIRFTVIGRPQPAGSKRAFAHPATGKIIVTDDAKGSRPWKQEVAGVAQDVTSEPLSGPLELEVDFYLARPKGHYGTGRNAQKVKDSAPAYPATKPDATKLLRAVEDALTGICYRDDAQVVLQRVRKLYGLPERCEVSVSSVTELLRDTTEGHFASPPQMGAA